MHASQIPHRKSNLTKCQRANLRKLAAYVLSLPEDYKPFNMRTYLTVKGLKGRAFEDSFPSQAKEALGAHTCGTTACLLGHGPSAGILPTGAALQDWADYAAYFGCHPVGKTRPLWKWVFGGVWQECAPTIEDAAMRVQYLLDYGIPVDFNHASPGWAALVNESYEIK